MNLLALLIVAYATAALVLIHREQQKAEMEWSSRAQFRRLVARVTVNSEHLEASLLSTKEAIDALAEVAIAMGAAIGKLPNRHFR